jgi:GTP-binding protein EngB required for normal cell division
MDRAQNINEVRRSGEPLRDYERFKFELAGLVRAAGAVAPRDSVVQREFQSLLARLAEDQFNLAVVGQFNRGKTSLMNAVLGLDRLPTGIVPLTSVITVVRYGSRDRVLVEYENSGLREEIAVADLPAYVTQDGNPGNQKRIRAVEVQLPAEVLRRGFRFIDTPGLGSAIAANTATTERFLPEADAIVFVTSCDAPLSELEAKYLLTACRLVRKTFVVINKLDLLSADERERVVAFVRERLNLEGVGDLPVHALSAREGLRAKLGRDGAALGASGVLEFERDLVEFLANEKARDFLARNCDRLLHLLRGSADAQLSGQVTELRARIVGQELSLAAHAAQGALVAAPRLCSVCQAVVKAVANFLSKYQYDISNDQQAQREHAATHGFCPLHTWQYERLASPRGVCSAYPPVLLTISDKLRRTPTPIMQPASRQHCPACRVHAEVEEQAVTEFVASLSESEGVTCLPHLRLFLSRLDPAAAKAIVARYATLLERIAEDMQRFVLKQDGLKRALISEEEDLAYRQGLALLVGDRRLASLPDPEVWL